MKSLCKLVVAVFCLSCAQIASAAYAVADISLADIPEESVLIHYGSASKAIALRGVKKYCSNFFKEHKKNIPVNDKTCRVMFSGEHGANGYLSLLREKNGSGIFLGWSQDKQESINLAFAKCEKSHKVCREFASWYQDAPFQESAAVVSDAGNCQATNRWTNRCINGDCTRTYSNGCVVRFQAPLCFNIMTNSHEFMPDGCR